MRTLLDEMKVGLGDLGSQTGTLVKALRQPQTRGQWGEVQLKRCVEIAGMTEHVDFELQQTLQRRRVRLRPDAVVMLPAGRRVVIDSKVPLDAYLEVLEAEDDASRKGELIRHSRQVRDHITKLSSKRYQDQFDSGESPDFVVCFMPSEAALHAAFEAEPALYDYALEQKILIATPTTLVGLLRTVELGWRQEQIAEQAQEIASASREPARSHGRLPRTLRQGRAPTQLGDQIVRRRGRLVGEPDHAAAAPHRGDGRRLWQGAGGAPPSRPRRAADPRRSERRVQGRLTKQAKDAPSAGALHTSEGGRGHAPRQGALGRIRRPVLNPNPRRITVGR